MIFKIKNKKKEDYWCHGSLPLWSKEFPVVISWSPKSGCTTILKWFLEQNGLLEDAYKFDPWVHEYREKVLYSQQGYKKNCESCYRENKDKKLIIKIIRDPIKRSVSSYLHFLRYMANSAKWIVVRELDYWKISNGISQQKGISFKQFLNFIINQNQRGYRIDPHLGFQFDKIQDPKVQKFIPIEHLSSELIHIEKRYNLKNININTISDSPHNNIPQKSHKWPLNGSSHPADHEYEKKLGVPGPEVFIDDETIQLIKNAYWRDFDAYSRYYNIYL